MCAMRFIPRGFLEQSIKVRGRYPDSLVGVEFEKSNEMAPFTLEPSFNKL